MLDKEKFIQETELSQGIKISLYYTAGGATDTDIIWVKKISRDGDITIIGKINWDPISDKIIIKRVDNNHIALHFIGRKDFMGRPIIFLIDLNNNIKKNDGTPFNIPE